MSSKILCVAEIAQTIVRNVTYEVPSLRKQVTKTDLAIEGLRKKQSDAIKRSNQLLAEHAAYTTELGIKGEDVAKELTDQLSDFPILLSEISDKLTSLKETIDFYRGFVHATTNTSPALCPIIEYLARKGNTTYFEYMNGEKPDVIEAIGSDIATKGEESPLTQEQTGIDFGDGVDYSDGIDFGDAIDFGDNENGSGSAGTGTTGSNGFVHVHGASSQRSSVDEINWDVYAQSSAVAHASASKVARGVDALSVIEFRGTRESIVHELYELECFLEQRIFEMNQEDQEMANVLLGSKLTLFTSDPKSLARMLDGVREVLTLFASPRLKMMYMIKEIPKFTETIARKLKQKRELARKAVAQAASLKEKEQQLMQEKMNMIAQIPTLIQVTTLLESKLTTDISARYKNRPVNIMAGAQVL